MPTTERNLVINRISEGEARISQQYRLIAQMHAQGGDAAAALMLLSAMESGQAMRRRRLAALSGV
jgi:hypothetical protein